MYTKNSLPMLLFFVRYWLLLQKLGLSELTRKQCFAIIIKHRNPTLNLLQKIISLVLYSGHSSKQVSFLLTGNSAPIIIVFVLVQVYHRLQPLNITVSYSSLLRLLKKVGENHDALVNTWKVAIVESMKNLEVCSYNHCITKVNLSHY